MSKDSEAIIHHEIQDSHNKVKEASYQHWQGLLTVNGFLASVLIGIAAFSPIQSDWLKVLVFIIIICILLASFSIILNMLLTKHAYNAIYKMIFDAGMFGKMPDETKK